MKCTCLRDFFVRPVLPGLPSLVVVVVVQVSPQIEKLPSPLIRHCAARCSVRHSTSQVAENDNFLHIPLTQPSFEASLANTECFVVFPTSPWRTANIKNLALQFSSGGRAVGIDVALPGPKRARVVASSTTGSRTPHPT